MRLISDSFSDGEALPARLAFGVTTEQGPAPAGGNRNPHLRWEDAPAATRSFALLCRDLDVPADLSQVNAEGVTIAAEAPRVSAAHWIVVDIPAAVTEIAEGAGSDGVAIGGTPPGPAAHGGSTGHNTYSDAFAAIPALAGEYGGYDGPFPPVNDARPHRYEFTLYALGVESLGLATPRLEEAGAAIAAHELANAKLTGTYSLFTPPAA